MIFKNRKKLKNHQGVFEAKKHKKGLHFHVTLSAL